jgi:hypothetical protein
VVNVREFTKEANNSLVGFVQWLVVFRGWILRPIQRLRLLAKDFSMSGHPKQIFHGISRAIFARLRRKASKFGIRVASPKGEAVKDGVVIQWNYDPGAELLEVECRAPFWLNSTQVSRNLRDEIEVVLRSARAA